jgi:tetratricopeptide (TPR) repeat protein
MYNGGMSFKHLLPIVIILPIVAFVAVLAVGYSSLAQAESALQKQDYYTATKSYAHAARWLFWRGDLYEKAAFAAIKFKDLPTAIYYFEHAEPTERGQLALAYCYYQIGDRKAAQRVFENGAQKYHTASFYEGLALIFHLQKNWDEERRAVEEQIRLDDGSASAHYRLGILLTLFEPDLALPELMRAAALDVQFDPAVQTLRAALNISAAQDDPAEKTITIGRALGLVEEWELALIAFESAIELDPQNPEAWAWLGEAKQHNSSDGRAELDRALSLGRKSPIVRGLRALYWNRQQKYPQALSEYLLAAEYDSQNPVWQASIGEAYTKTGDLVSALKAHQRATELAPSESKYWRLLAFFCAENGVSTEEVGLSAAQKAVDLSPEDPLALDTLGYVYYATGRYANAEKILSDVAARFPRQYSAHIHLAMNYLAQGNSAAARQTLTYVRSADPDGTDGLLAARLLEKYFP